MEAGTELLLMIALTLIIIGAWIGWKLSKPIGNKIKLKQISFKK